LLPDELEHEEFVEVGVQEGAGDGIQLPVMVVSATGEIDDHGGITLPQSGQSAEMRND